MTTIDHKRLVLEGVDILKQENDELDPNCKTFELIGRDPFGTELKSFWWKTRYIFCNEFYSLCPPKKNLEVNLRNHIGGTRYAEKMMEATKGKQYPTISSKWGRPAKSTADNSQSNQRQLHVFFGHVVDSP